MVDFKQALKAISIETTASLFDILEAYDVTEILDALWAQDDLHEDIKQWAKETVLGIYEE